MLQEKDSAVSIDLDLTLIGAAGDVASRERVNRRAYGAIVV